MKGDDEIADFGISALLKLAAPRLYAAYGRRPVATYRAWLREVRGVLRSRSGESTAEAALGELIARLPDELGDEVPPATVKAARRVLALLGHEKTDEAWDDCGARILAEDAKANGFKKPK